LRQFKNEQKGEYKELHEFYDFFMLFSYCMKRLERDKVCSSSFWVGRILFTVSLNIEGLQLGSTINFCLFCLCCYFAVPF